MPLVPLLGPTRLAAGGADTPLLGAHAVPEAPLVGVDLDETASADVFTAAARRARECDRILVGVSRAGGTGLPPRAARLARELDVTLVRHAPGGEDGRASVGVADPAAELARLADAATATPQAALVLAGLLRTTESLPVRDALDAESLAYSALLGGAEFRRWLAARGPGRAPVHEKDPVLLVREGPMLTVILNRPARRNAYDRAVRDALVEALTLAVLDPTVSRLVLTGAGPAFCSGGDLDEFGTAADPVTAHLVRTRHGAGRLLHRLSDRVEARLHGACVGSGIELPAFAGTVRAAPGTTVRLPETAMGLIPGAGGTVSLPRRIGRWRTLHLALSGRAIDARTALDWGLVDVLNPPGDA